MATLPKEKLLEYMKHAIELESSIYSQKQIRKLYAKSSDSRKPTLIQKEMPQVPVRNVKNPVLSDSMSIVYVLVGLGGLLMIYIGCLAMADGMGFLGFIFLAIGVMLVLPAILVIHERLTLKSSQRKLDEIYGEEYIAYVQKKKKVTDENENIKKRYNEDCRKWQSSNQKVYEFLDSKHDQTQKTLETLYAMDVVFPKYRTLPALTSIYEYIISGRCDELAGPNGAYNLYEDELRKNIIITQLNTIISNLEQIRQNQYMLYEEMHKAQENTRIIANELNEIKGYTAEISALSALNTYYNSISANNSYIRSL